MGDLMRQVLAIGGGSRHALVKRVISLVAVLATAVSVLFLVSGSAASASQFDIRAIICSILLALRGAFGGFLAGIFNALLGAFGCGTPSG